MYRILESPDGEHWTDNAVNNRTDPSEAVSEINFHAGFNRFGRWKLVNPETGAVIYQKHGVDVGRCKVCETGGGRHAATCPQNPFLKGRRARRNESKVRRRKVMQMTNK